MPSPSFSLLRFLLAALAGSSTLCAGHETVKPESVGLSSTRLQRVDDVIQRHIAANNVAGAIVVVARKGQVAHFQPRGVMDLESRKPMARDAIFRLASMTK